MPLDALSDGFVKLCIDTSLNFYDGKCRILIEGQYVENEDLASPIVPDEPIRIQGRRYVNDMFTSGSVLAESLHTIFDVAGEGIDVYALPRLDNPTGATAAQYTLTVATNAGSTGTATVTIGPWSFDIDVTSGDTPAVTAAALKTLLDAIDPFPFDVSISGAVITFDAKSTGGSGNLLTTGVQTQLSQTYTIARPTAGAGATKAVYKMVVAGPADTDGSIDLFMGNEQYSFTGLAITSGDTAAEIAAAIAAKVPSRLPYNVFVYGDTILFEAKNAGTVGNFFNPVVNWRGFQNYYPAGVTLTTTRLVAGATDPEALDYSSLGDCCYNVFALLSGDRTWQQGLIEYVRDKWDCTKPQCFGHAYTYNSGSLGTVLATFENAGEISKVAAPLNGIVYPWQLVANYAALTALSACTNPELSIQGRDYGRLTGIKVPMSCRLPWTYAEQTQLQDNGFVTYGPLGLGQSQLTYLYIQNDVTNWLYDELNRENVTFRDASSRRLAQKTAVEIATELNKNSGLGLYTRNTKIPQGIKGTNVRLITGKLQDWARSQVGILFSAFDNLDRDLIVLEDFEVAPPCQGKPCVLHSKLRYRPPCRIARINQTLMPKVLDNCDR